MIFPYFDISFKCTIFIAIFASEQRKFTNFKYYPNMAEETFADLGKIEAIRRLYEDTPYKAFSSLVLGFKPAA